MNVQVLTKNLSAEEDIIPYAEKKMTRLSKYSNHITGVKVELSREKSKSRKQLYTAQATININGFLIRGEQKAENLKAAVDSVTDVMERLVTKFKKKYEVTKGRESVSIRRPKVAVSEPGIEAVTVPHLVKTKRFIVKPMTVEQAIDQMEFLGHDFFLFLNAEDDAVNVVYRRKDGKYGLIIPEFA